LSRGVRQRITFREERAKNPLILSTKREGRKQERKRLSKEYRLSHEKKVGIPQGHRITKTRNEGGLQSKLGGRKKKKGNRKEAPVT